MAQKLKKTQVAGSNTKATKKTSLGNRQMEKLLAYAREGGLPDIYGTNGGKDREALGEWLYDFWPDLSWNDEQEQDIKDILADKKFVIVQAFFIRQFGFNFRQYLKASMQTSEESGGSDHNDFFENTKRTHDPTATGVSKAGNWSHTCYGGGRKRFKHKQHKTCPTCGSYPRLVALEKALGRLFS